MPNTVLVGAQWGDEGKGKIIDVLTEDVDVVVRYQGGNNAGHTVKIDGETYILHLIPSGILHDGKICVIGNGLVIDPVTLLSEISELKKKGIQLEGRLFISNRAHAVFPYHRVIDVAKEAKRDDHMKIGTTKRGIGPTYCDKISRSGLRMGDLISSDFCNMLSQRIDDACNLLKNMGENELDKDEVMKECLESASNLTPYITDTVTDLNRYIEEGKSLLFEGAQGTMLDIDFGTYPFVTSSNASVGGACTGTGVAPCRIDRVIGVIKAYTTRVGEGPFPTELFDDTGKRLSKEGHEFGATTGRPRRCGWFDAVIGRYSAMINGVDFWALTKLDVLDNIETLKICVSYEHDGKIYKSIPGNSRIMQNCKPVYEEMEGWQTSTKDITNFEDLPYHAKAYINRICELTGVKLALLSVGPGRKNTLRIAI